jgi:hypothetical protein
LPLLPQPWLLYVMHLEKVRSSIVAKAMFASVLLLLNVYLVYVIQCQLVRT